MGGYTGAGLEQGADLSDAKPAMTKRRRSKPDMANALFQATTASTWTAARECGAIGEEHGGSGNCSCGAVGDDSHRMWGDCSARPQHEDFGGIE
eukprot:9197265-Pyramimonas_sp.AAC.2